jgi:predicted PurR-regulated permease PerM
MDNRVKIDISTTTILKFFGIILLLAFVYAIRNVILMLFVVLIIVAALDPMVTKLEKSRVPRWISAFFIYLVVIGFFALAFYWIIPPIVAQITTFANNFPTYVNQITPLYQSLSSYVTDWQKILGTATQNLSGVTSSIFDVTKTFFGGIATVITVIIISYYLLLERSQAEKFMISLMPEKKRGSIIKIMEGISYKIGGWTRGQFLLSLIMGTSTAVVALLGGVPYALLLGLIAALLEIFPVVGVTIVGILVVSSTWFFGGFIKAMIVLAVFVGLHQLESSILIPKIMGKAVELSAAVILVALLVGGTLAGIPGAILAIPAAAGIAVFLKEWPTLRNK